VKLGSGNPNIGRVFRESSAEKPDPTVMMLVLVWKHDSAWVVVFFVHIAFGMLSAYSGIVNVIQAPPPVRSVAMSAPRNDSYI
jgi:hypothetical protein